MRLGESDDYWEHKNNLKLPNGEFSPGYDMWTGGSVDWAMNETYSTKLFGDRAKQNLRDHARRSRENREQMPFFMYLAFQAPHCPLQAPQHYKQQCEHIDDDKRRTYCAMVLQMDQQIGEVIQTLKQTNQYENTIIFFASDNGGDFRYGASNYPLNGLKGTFWDGGTRVNGFLHSAQHFPAGKSTFQELFHAADFYATILGMTVGGSEVVTYGDGFNQWPDLTHKSQKVKRIKFIYDVKSEAAALRWRQYKLIIGQPGYVNWLSCPLAQGLPFAFYEWPNTVYLFDIDRDISEKRNLAKTRPNIVRRLTNILSAAAREAPPALPMPIDLKGDPKHFNNTFGTGWC